MGTFDADVRNLVDEHLKKVEVERTDHASPITQGEVERLVYRAKRNPASVLRTSALPAVRRAMEHRRALSPEMVKIVPGRGPLTALDGRSSICSGFG